MSDSPDSVAEAAPELESEAKKETHAEAIWREAKGLFWVLLAVLAFHSFIAKPFYIPSESMMPNLLVVIVLTLLGIRAWDSQRGPFAQTLAHVRPA